MYGCKLLCLTVYKHMDTIISLTVRVHFSLLRLNSKFNSTLNNKIDKMITNFDYISVSFPEHKQKHKPTLNMLITYLLYFYLTV